MIFSVPAEYTSTPRLMTLSELFRCRDYIPPGRNLTCISDPVNKTFVYVSGRRYESMETDASSLSRNPSLVYPVFSFSPEEFPELTPGIKIEVSGKSSTVIDKGLAVSDVPLTLTGECSAPDAINHMLKFSREEIHHKA